MGSALLSVLVQSVMEKLAEKQEYELIFTYLQEGKYNSGQHDVEENMKRAIRRKAKSFSIQDGMLHYVEGQFFKY